MVHHAKEGFVLAVLNNHGNVLREHNGTVYLSYDSEYSILVKNQKNFRVGIEVFIDGTSMLGNRKLIIEGNTSRKLSRMMIDGDLNNGPAFKFVRLNNSEVQDPTSSENGKIEVKFYHTNQQTVRHPLRYRSDFKMDNIPVGTASRPFGGFSNESLRPKTVIGDSVLYASCNTNITSSIDNSSPNGATVGGSNINQSFQEVSIFCCEFPFATLTLNIRASKESITVTDTRINYCPQCGKRVKLGDRFCSRCGKSLGVEIPIPYR